MTPPEPQDKAPIKLLKAWGIVTLLIAIGLLVYAARAWL